MKGTFLCLNFLLISLILLKKLTETYPLKPTRVGCQECHSIDPSRINVHLMAHSHDDVGWLKTVDDYYYGFHDEIQKACVKDIITTMVEALKANPERRFMQVETAFFWKWWENSTKSMQEDFVQLVNSGQLEMVNGAWSMNDEAATHYHSIIDQFTYGLRTINNTVGKCGAPRIGWQIDSFGHSREQANIFAQLGYDGVFFARIDYEDKTQRIDNKDMEVIWRGSPENNWASSNIFTNMFPDFYFPPYGFCFDIGCGIDSVTDENAADKMDMLVKEVKQFSTYYKTKNVLVPMGGDFHFRSASTNFKSLDKLTEVFKHHDKLNVIYSTPSCYIKAVNDEARLRNVMFALKKDDFFPYGSKKHAYWTGYFSSRPTAKRLERAANNFLQSAKQLAAFASVKTSSDWIEDLIPLKQAIGIMQHHDAITGTAKQRVADDYVRLMVEGIGQVGNLMASTVQDLLLKPHAKPVNLHLQTCLLTNITICEPSTSTRKFIVTLYNPLERPVTHHVRLPVSPGTYTVIGSDGPERTDILNPITPSSSKKELVFRAKNIPAFGIKLYYVEQISFSLPEEQEENFNQFKFGDTEFGNGFEIDESSFLLKSVTLNGEKLEVKQDFLYYLPADGNNRNNDQASGAYIFRPKENEALRVTAAGNSVKITRKIGKLVDEVRQEFASWLTQIIRVYKNTDDEEIGRFVEFDWLVGPIDEEEGREIITRFSVANFNSDKTFYTDSNGREMLKRVLNERDDFEYSSENEPVSANYYPVTAKISIRDEKRGIEVGVLNDRAQGGTSLKNGQLELMVHRRLLKDDDKGVHEPLNEKEFGKPLVVRGSHYLTFEDVKNRAEERILALKLLLAPTLLVGGVDFNLRELRDSYNFEFEGLKSYLPPNIHILTFEPISKNEHILRLEHFIEKNENETLSQPVVVDLKNLFTLFEIESLRETTLGANQWRDEFDAQAKYAWTLNDGKVISNKPNQFKLEQGEINGIVLEPMQIRTFIVKIIPNSY